MSLRKRLLVKPAAAPGGLVPSEHFGVVLYEGDGTSSHSINGGKFGAGAYFGGGSSFDTGLSTTNFVSDLNDRTVDFSFSCWAQIHSYPQGDNTIFYIGNYNVYSPNYAAIILDFRSASKKIRFTHQTQYIESTSTFNAPMTTWVHVAAVRDNSVLKLYIDGSLEANVTLTADTQVSSSTTLDIGGFQFGSGTIYSGLEGKIDQVRIFQKALSSSEVSTLYAETVDTVESLDPLSEDTTETLQVLGDSSCIATYRFENNEDDESGNFDGTGTEIQYAAGRYGQAASFNGTASRISTSLDLDNYDENWSISYWVKFTFDTNYRAILGSTDSNVKNGMITDIGTSGEIRFRLRDNTGSESPLTSTDTYGDGNWHHVVCVKASNSNHLYIDGELDSSTATTNGINHSALNFGTFGLSSNEFLKGELDQVRVFNKAISASEVTTLYNENSLVASYRFEGNANDDTRNYDGSATNVSYEYGLNFTPDFVWVKERTSTSNNYVTDSSRTLGQVIVTDLNIAESAAVGGISSLDTGGFTVGSHAGHNENGQDYVAWCFKANGGTTSSNTNGTITSTVQVNDTAGFSIVKWTGTTTTSDTIGHGLSTAPEIVILKNLDATGDWFVYTTLIDGSFDYLRLNTTGTKGNSGRNAPTSTVFDQTTLGSSISTGNECIGYCFYSVDSFSKFGSYTGNGSADGPIVETGFEPAFLMIKRTDTSGAWQIYDNKRNTTNPRYLLLQPQATDAEIDLESLGLAGVGFYSNGFQILDTNTSRNASGGTYLYMAFAADPDTEAPAVAKSFSTVTYTGNGTSQDIEGLGFSPSLVWLKSRDRGTTPYTGSNYLYDTIRGPLQRIKSESTDAESTFANSLTSFNSDGFSLGSGNNVNYSGDDFVAWAWKADDNEPTINTEGSIDSIVSANANAGFSIVKYEANGVSGSTIGHGLSAAPEFIITKRLDSNASGGFWYIYSSVLGTTKTLVLNGTNAQISTSNSYLSVGSTTYEIGTNGDMNTNGGDFIAYCFHSVAGFSKFGSYTGNGTAGHSITGLGFQPDWIMIKRTTNTQNWVIADSVRGDQVSLFPNLSNAESDQAGDDITSLDSNGFTVGTNAKVNSNGDTYIYMAFKIN